MLLISQPPYPFLGPAYITWSHPFISAHIPLQSLSAIGALYWSSALPYRHIRLWIQNNRDDAYIALAYRDASVNQLERFYTHPVVWETPPIPVRYVPELLGVSCRELRHSMWQRESSWIVAK